MKSPTPACGRGGRPKKHMQSFGGKFREFDRENTLLHTIGRKQEKHAIVLQLI